MDVCVCLFRVCAVLCVGSGLATGWSPVQGVLPTILGLRKCSETGRSTDALRSNVGATGKRERDWICGSHNGDYDGNYILDVTPCSPVEVHPKVGGTYFHLQGRADTQFAACSLPTACLVYLRPWNCRQYLLSKRRWTSTGLHNIHRRRYLLKVFLGNGSVNTFQSATMEDGSQWKNVIAHC
jgi:hypothetical protein